MAVDSPRPHWLLCVVFGAGVIALIAWLAVVTPGQTCGSTQWWGTPPFLAYQLSRSTADIEAVFGEAGDPCRAKMIAALDFANKIDLFGSIATYCAFLACFFFALRRYGWAAFAQIGLIAVIAIFIFGLLEASIRLRITGSLPGAATSLTLLSIGDTGKYLGIAGAGACAGIAMLARGGILGRLAGIVCIAGAAMVVVGLNYSLARPALSIGFGILSLVMLLYAAAAAMRSV